jgi:hypothetical protein
MFCNMLVLLRWIGSPTPNPPSLRAWGPTLVGCPRMPIFTATHHIWPPSLQTTTRRRVMAWWKWNTQTGGIRVSKSFRTESITKYTLMKINIRWEATQRVMAAKFTTLTHKIAIQLHLVAETSTILSSRSRRPVRKLLDTPSYMNNHRISCGPTEIQTRHSLNSARPTTKTSPPHNSVFILGFISSTRSHITEKRKALSQF